MKPINILLLFGGESSEHAVSIASAKNIYDAIDKTIYTIDLCYIDTNGRWWHSQTLDDFSEDEPKLGITIHMNTGTVAREDGHIFSPDVILPVLHGSNGEDGSIQGLAQLLHIPIVGSQILGSSVCMDKEITKKLLAQSGIKVVDWLTYRSENEPMPYEDVISHLGSPVFVKPAAQGSSVGVSKVRNAGEYHAALELAARYDTKVLIEKAIEGRELEVAVMGNYQPVASRVGEIVLGDEFYSYEEKYSDSSHAKVTIPADISDTQHDDLQKAAIAAYKTLECRGLSRVDFFLSKDGRVYVNEINTFPGFTNISMYPKLWEAEGVSYSELITKLIDYALEK